MRMFLLVGALPNLNADNADIFWRRACVSDPDSQS